MSQQDLLSFEEFDLSTVLKNGVKLLSSTGKEYDIFANGASVADRLAQAKADMARMGLGSMGGVDLDLGLDVEEELKQGELNTSRAKASTSSSPQPLGLPSRLAAQPSKLPSPRFAPSASSPGPTPLRSVKQEEPSSPVPMSGVETTASPALPTPTEDIDMSKLSARERNQLKRKRKLEGRSASGGQGPPESGKTFVVDTAAASKADTLSAATGLRVKTPSTASGPASNGQGGPAKDYLEAGHNAPTAPGTPDASTPAGSPESSGPTSVVQAGVGGDRSASAKAAVSLVAPPGEWPFAHLASVLLMDIFSPRWETRHGACLALRSVFTAQGAGAGMSLLASQDENGKRKSAWAEDCAVKLICLLSLDRLSDFVFDQVVAPVREVGAQALSALLPHLSPRSVQQAQTVLLDMARQSFAVPESAKSRMARRGDPGYAWEVRHAGLSGLRWIIEVGPQIKNEPDTDPLVAISEIADTAMQCLRDSDDDIRAVASIVLLPLASGSLVNELSDKLPALLETLWGSLSDLKDDLNSSTGSVMDLLATLLRHDVVTDLVQKSERPLKTLVPLTYPFFRHTITSVRLSVVNTLQVFLNGLVSQDDWLDDRVFRLLFQNLIVEEKPRIREATSTAWQAAIEVIAKTPGKVEALLAPHLPAFMKILMTPLGTPFDFSLFFSPVAASVSTDGSRYNVDKSILNQDLSLVGVDTVIRGRLGAAHALGVATVHLWNQNADSLLPYLDSASALQKCLAATVAQEWAENGGNVASSTSSAISEKLLAIINAPPPATWSEMAVRLNKIQMDCSALYRAFGSDGRVAKAKIPALPAAVDPLGVDPNAFTPGTAQRVVTTDFDALMAAVGPRVRKTAAPILEDRRNKIIAGLAFYKDAKDKQDTQVYAAVSAALIALKTLPPKLNPIIRSIMNSVKFEENVDLQQRSARAVANFIAFCRSPEAKADPSPKIVKNLCAFVCQDTTQTAVFASASKTLEGILSLDDSSAASGRGRVASGKAKIDVGDSGEVLQGKLIRRGAEMAIQEMARKFSQDLFETAPALCEGMTATLMQVFGRGPSSGDSQVAENADLGQGILDCCTLIEVVSYHLSATHRERLESVLSLLTAALQSKYAVIRSAAARTLSVLAETNTQDTMLHIVQHTIALLGDPASVTNRQGAIELLSHAVERLDLKILPYVIVLVVPVLGRMSDPNDQVRLMATNTFAALVKMVPLEASLPDPPGFPAELLKRREEERKFLSQLLDGNKVEPYELPVKVNVDLRKYQREGVSWMNFLAKFQLHGVLCDDMGLGKTLQSICILSAKHWERDQRYKETQAQDAAPLPSLVVCPPTLTGHWVHEIRTYANNLRPLLYSGLPAERTSLKGQIAKHDVVVMSYDVVRNDIAYLSTLNWNYCILDEGHIIKGAKTKTTKAVKMIKANHRLILTGTPIQNNVLELWSLFDFLMPGFLGTERAFHERFGRPILATREGKASAKEQEAAALALESLHKQVLPFLLRRLKDDVLDDLPPKIIQDVECDLGPIQKRLYDEYSKSRALGNLDEVLDSDADLAGAAGGNGADGQQHVFQTLQYLRKLVNHPSLVFDASNPKHKAIEDDLAKSGGSLRDISHAPKLETLMQLLQSCGIGAAGAAQQQQDANADLAGSGAEAVSQHRVLIFCQMKQMMDIIEHDLFRQHMPSVSYMRMDGSVPSEKRHGIVQTFNSDPSIDVLLLTTQVGGLGLTLTGADTVIFVEHDWNPMKDLQAMDRAHRLGQKKVVNVYRLITRDTLEAKIMGLQQFKLNVANTVISQQNAGLDSMSTDQVLDLFSASAGTGGPGSGPGAGAAGADKNRTLLEAATAAAKGKGKGKGFISQKAILANLESMGDTGEDYEKMAQWRPESS